MKRPRLVAILPSSAIALALLTADSSVLAQVKPFRINGGGVILEDLPFTPGATSQHNSIGRGTAGLGRYNGLGAVEILTVDLMSGTGTFQSAFAYRFAKNGNGDVLAFQYGRTDPGSGASPPAQRPGSVMVIPVGNQGMIKTVWLAEFNPVPSECTGKFRNVVSGSFIMLAESQAFMPGVTPGGVPFIPGGTPYTWEGRGTIVFRPPGR